MVCVLMIIFLFFFSVCRTTVFLSLMYIVSLSMSYSSLKMLLFLESIKCVVKLM